MIDTIVFDMGQVLIHWTGELLLEKYGLSEEDKGLLLRELFGDVEWIQLDHGTLAPEQAVEAVCRRVPEHLHGVVREVVTGWWHQPMRPIPGMAGLVRELKGSGYGIYLLSNAGVTLREYFPRIPGAECFDGLMVSAEEKLLKPNPEIFRALLERFGLEAERCFFVDDSPANVEGAMSAGISGCVFKGSVSELRRKLRSAGIRCAE
ncbi:MAG: HAD family hydrolase [Faecousia sp.]